MLNRRCRLLPLASMLLLSFLLVGCSSSRTEHFDVDVRNNSNQPLTLSLTKDGPPYEATWASPEDLAIESPHRREDWRNTPSGMSVLAPGKTASIRNTAGNFDSGTHAILRVYAGDLTISQMLAKSPGSPDRVDVQLQPGANDVTIVSEGAHLKAVPTGGGPAAPAR